MKKILLLFCGGTISMSKDENWGLVSKHGYEQLLSIDSRIQYMADIDVITVASLDSTNATPRLWEKLGEIIEKNYSNYDGFLITTWTNTMAYMASALSFSLTNTWKPIVITGAQIPMEILYTDGKNNLVNALRVTLMDIWCVAVVFGSKIILWCRSKKLSESDLDAFGSFNARELGEIWLDIRLLRDDFPTHTDKLILRNWFEDKIMSITLFPGISNEYLEKMFDIWIKWFILRWYGTGDVSDYIFPFLQKCQEKLIPVVITTQCRWSTIMGLDSVWFEALKYWVIEAYDMSIETMTTKLMWLLSQKCPYQEIKNRMQENMHWEINTKKSLTYKGDILLRSIKEATENTKK